MRPRKEVWLYHPNRLQGRLKRFAFATRLRWNVEVIDLEDLQSVPSTVALLILFCPACIKLINPHTRRRVRMSLSATNETLMETARGVVARRAA